MTRILPCLRKRSVVPHVAMVGKTVVDVTKLALLDVLFDGVQLL